MRSARNSGQRNIVELNGNQPPIRWIFAVLFLCMAVPAPSATRIDFARIVRLAETFASKPYQSPPEIPDVLRELNYQQYQNIRFDPQQSLWGKSNSNFQVMLIPPGLYYTHPVKINLIEHQGVRPLAFDKSLFTYDDPEIEKRIPPDLGYAGLKLTFPLSAPGEQNQFLVFAGASYFRGVGTENAWGISARGIAVDTGLASGEEFPSFIEFWLESPEPDAKEMVLYGLLDGPRISGAYQFNVRPGMNTVVDVNARLFARSNIELIGIAPLTSMFFYGENTTRPTGQWRGEVHDSDGLLIHNGSTGEWLWRPLLNPKTLQMDFFSIENPRGFGLMQRDTDFSNYQDLAARYQARPSAWVEPDGDWGPGKVVLVQLPTDDETNDNIVAFWSPETPFTEKSSLSMRYRLGFGRADLPGESMARAVRTFVGDGGIIGGGAVPGSYRLLIDFAGTPLDGLKADAPIQGVVTGLDGTDVIEQYVEFNEPAQVWRLSMLARPAEDKALALRAFLKMNDAAVSETWSYRLPGENDIRGSGE
ncbi:MAG: glucan biosynthesis protein G [Gammaproteobacteria bacterium]